MLIRNLIKNDFETAGPYEGINSIKKIISCNDAVVIVENGVYVGILTANDLLAKPHNLIIDCLIAKPSVTPAQSIAEAGDLMRRNNTPALPVYENSTFVGIITYSDVSQRLQQITDNQQYTLQSTAHDLKNPILNILSLVSLLKTDFVKEEAEEIAREAEQACNYAMELINGLLKNGDGENGGNFETADINALIKDCVKSVMPQAAEKSITFTATIAEAPFYYPVQPVLFCRAINNLLYNAVKFTAQGGSVLVSSTQDASRTTIRVQDNGIGIPPELQPIIFNKFTKAKRKGTNFEPSTGLGLYITRQIIEQHRGKLWFESGGGGTVFFINFEKQSEAKKTP